METQSIDANQITERDPFISINEAARLIDVHPQTLRRYLTEHRLQRFRVCGNGRTLVRRADVLALVKPV